MKYLFFDVETTGLPKNYKAPYTDVANWPRIVQLSWLIADEMEVVKESDNIIKVDFPIPLEVSMIHGITNEITEAKGKTLLSVSTEFLNDLKSVDVIVCHNISYDLTVLQAELVRLKLDPNITKKTFCTMKNSVDYCKLPGPYGYKWPKLEELYKRCFSEKLENAHNAMVDVAATFKVFQKLKTENVFLL
ncbi:MAG: 3'-5' exonuclease [Bacteriovoracaceae bacterium]